MYNTTCVDTPEIHAVYMNICTHMSTQVKETELKDALDRFENRYGYDVEVRFQL